MRRAAQAAAAAGPCRSAIAASQMPDVLHQPVAIQAWGGAGHHQRVRDAAPANPRARRATISTGLDQRVVVGGEVVAETALQRPGRRQAGGASCQWR